MDAARILFRNALAYAVEDAYPVSLGHTLIISQRHVADFFDLTVDELTAMHEALRIAHQRLTMSRHPDGFNVGVNVGTVAGQTVSHAHLHLIPRFVGDVENPTGGVRNIIPGKGCYV
jgi:diadenosine tetraphosphate (Ap4A) HIT family hydrolase